MQAQKCLIAKMCELTVGKCLFMVNKHLALFTSRAGNIYPR